jgi:hypothetical protein
MRHRELVLKNHGQISLSVVCSPRTAFIVILSGANVKIRTIRAASIVTLALAGLSVRAPGAWAAPKTCDSAPTTTASVVLATGTQHDIGVGGQNTCRAHQVVTATLEVMSGSCASWRTSFTKSLGPDKAFSTSVSLPAGCQGQATVSVANSIGGDSVIVDF